MKQMLSYFALAFLVTTLTVTTGLAQGKNRNIGVTLSENMVVGETVVEKGDYRLKFNAETNEVQLLRDGDLVKTIKARVVEETAKAPYTALMTKASDKGKQLVSVRMEGDRRTLLLAEMNTGAVTGEGQN